MNLPENVLRELTLCRANLATTLMSMPVQQGEMRFANFVSAGQIKEAIGVFEDFGKKFHGNKSYWSHLAKAATLLGLNTQAESFQNRASSAHD
jgi:hypothetical protein